MQKVVIISNDSIGTLTESTHSKFIYEKFVCREHLLQNVWQYKLCY